MAAIDGWNEIRVGRHDHRHDRFRPIRRSQRGPKMRHEFGPLKAVVPLIVVP
jgi:hypothetical protein